MNGGFQFDDVGEIIKLILVIVIVIPFLGAMFSLIGSLNTQNCPQCEDCSVYKENLSNISQQLEVCKNQSQEIIYVNQTIEVPGPERIVEKPIFKDSTTSITLISISLILSIFLTIKLFRISIKLPKEVEEKIKEHDKWIVRFKWFSLAISILILIKLIIIFINL